MEDDYMTNSARKSCTYNSITNMEFKNNKLGPPSGSVDQKIYNFEKVDIDDFMSDNESSKEADNDYPMTIVDKKGTKMSDESEMVDQIILEENKNADHESVTKSVEQIEAESNDDIDDDNNGTSDIINDNDLWV